MGEISNECPFIKAQSQRALKNVPLSEEQKSQTTITASLGGSRVEECAVLTQTETCSEDTATS